MPRERSSRSAALKAARLSRLPGVTMAAACAQYGVTRSALTKARKELAGERRSRDDLLLVSLTKQGTLDEGTLPDDYGALAAWFDYVDHDGCAADVAQGRVQDLADRGLIAIDGDRWSLLVPWPSDAPPTPN